MGIVRRRLDGEIHQPCVRCLFSRCCTSRQPPASHATFTTSSKSSLWTAPYWLHKKKKAPCPPRVTVGGNPIQAQHPQREWTCPPPTRRARLSALHSSRTVSGREGPALSKKLRRRASLWPLQTRFQRCQLPPAIGHRTRARPPTGLTCRIHLPSATPKSTQPTRAARHSATPADERATRPNASRRTGAASTARPTCASITTRRQAPAGECSSLRSQRMARTRPQRSARAWVAPKRASALAIKRRLNPKLDVLHRTYCYWLG